MRATGAAKLRASDNAEAANELMHAPVLLDKIYRRVLLDPGNRQRSTESMAAIMASVDEEAQKNVGFFMRFHFVQLIMHCAVRLYLGNKRKDKKTAGATKRKKTDSGAADAGANGLDVSALRIDTSEHSDNDSNDDGKVTPRANHLQFAEGKDEKNQQQADTMMANALSQMHEMVLLPLKEHRPRFFQRHAWRKNVLYVKEIDLVLSRYSSALKVGETG